VDRERFHNEALHNGLTGGFFPSDDWGAQNIPKRFLLTKKINQATEQ